MVKSKILVKQNLIKYIKITKKQLIKNDIYRVSSTELKVYMRKVDIKYTSTKIKYKMYHLIKLLTLINNCFV